MNDNLNEEEEESKDSNFGLPINSYYKRFIRPSFQSLTLEQVIEEQNQNVPQPKAVI